MKVHRMKERRCLRCGESLDAATPILNSEHQPPSPGDVSICFKCNHIAIFTRGGKLREPRADELRSIMADQHVTNVRNAWNLFYADKGRAN